VSKPETPASVRSALKRLVVATVILYTVLTLVIVFVMITASIQRTNLKNETTKTTSALCTLRSDFVHRIAESRAFLRSHPNGLDGISPADIQRSIDGLKETVSALGTLDCERGKGT
jgi:hypothetical protein